MFVCGLDLFGFRLVLVVVLVNRCRRFYFFLVDVCLVLYRSCFVFYFFDVLEVGCRLDFISYLVLSRKIGVNISWGNFIYGVKDGKRGSIFYFLDREVWENFIFFLIGFS